jgi:hypothetical protein
VVVGINDYPGTQHDLKGATADAQDVDAALAHFGVPRGNRLLLRDRQATGPAIRSAVDWLAARAGPDAVAVFFFAGHVRRIGAGREALVAADRQTIADEELAARLDALEARRAWIGVAACYGGGFAEVLKPGWVLTAAADDEIAYENTQLGRSYLVEYMVRRAMLDGRAPQSVEAAFAYARAEIDRLHPGRSPVQVDTDAADVDLRPVPTSQGPSSAPATPASPPSGPPAATPTTSTSTVPRPSGDTCGEMTAGLLRCGTP